MYPCTKLAVPDEMVVPVQSKLSLWANETVVLVQSRMFLANDSACTKYAVPDNQ